MPHQNHLQYHLLLCTAYTIIAKHKQIGWDNIKQSYVYKKIIYPNNHTKENSIPSSHMATTMFWDHKHIKGKPPFDLTWPQPWFDIQKHQRNLILSFHFATIMLIVFCIFLWVPQDVLLPHLSATTDRARVGNHATNHTP